MILVHRDHRVLRNWEVDWTGLRNWEVRPPTHGGPPHRYTSHHTPTATFGVLNRPECTFLSITGVPLILSSLLVRDNAIRDAFRLRNWWNRVQYCSKESKFSAPAASWTKTGNGVSFRNLYSTLEISRRGCRSWSVANAFLPKRLGKYYGLPQTPGPNFTIIQSHINQTGDLSWK